MSKCKGIHTNWDYQVLKWAGDEGKISYPCVLCTMYGHTDFSFQSIQWQVVILEAETGASLDTKLAGSLILAHSSKILKNTFLFFINHVIAIVLL